MVSIFWVLFVYSVFSVILYVAQSRGAFYKVNSARSPFVETALDCDAKVTEQLGCLYSPEYPSRYRRYSSCLYVIQRYSKDVCEIKLTFNSFDVSESRNCSQDYLELQDGDKRIRICGTLPPESKKFLFFPKNSDTLTLKFKSSFHSNNGFDISVKQLRYSCFNDIRTLTTTTSYPRMTALPLSSCDIDVYGRWGRITSPGFPNNYPAGQKCTYTIHRSEPRACLIELDIRRFDVRYSYGCVQDFLMLPDGTRLCGTIGAAKRSVTFPLTSMQMMLVFASDITGGNGKGFDIQVNQLPGPCESQYYEPPPRYQCDQEMSENSGTFTSPGYPRSFGPNYYCTYNVRRPDPSVCQLELHFVVFDLGSHNPATCSPGAYFELPGRVRICNPFTGRKVLEVSEFQDPVQFHFVSDGHSSGKGFRIDVKQIPNTCKGFEKEYPVIPEALRRCYQEVKTETGYFSSPKHVSGTDLMHDRCEFVVKKVHPTVCKLQLQVTFRRDPLVPCTTNYIELPGGEHLCLEAAPAKEIHFPKGTTTMIMIYHGRDGAEFNVIVNQVLDSCPKQTQLVMPAYMRNPWMWHYRPR